MQISLFKTTSPVTCEAADAITVEELCTLITTDSWSPSLFTDGYRKKANFISVSLLVLDVDGGCSLEEAREHFGQYKHIIATTRSHQKAKSDGTICDRFRVILWLSETITESSVYAATWRHYAKRWPFIDPACKDESRFYFPCVNVISATGAGELIPVIVESSSSSTKEQAPGPIKPQLKSLPTGATKGKLSVATKNFLVEGADPGTWNTALFLAAKDMQEQGYGIDEATEKLASMSNPSYSGTLDAADYSTIASAFKVDPKYEARKSFPVVELRKDGSSVVNPYHIRNVVHLISHVAGWSLRYNELKKQQLVTKPGCIEKPLDDDDLPELRTFADDYNIRVGKDRIIEALTLIAQENTFHPSKQFIEQATWDGADHISALFETITLDEQEMHFCLSADEYSSEEVRSIYATLFKKWLVSVVAKIYQPVGGSNLMLVLKGEQGTGKSTWLKNLSMGPGTLVESGISPDDKDHYARLLDFNLWVADEFDGSTRKADIAHLKAFLSTEIVNVRRAFARYTSSGYSQCSFCGSVNGDDILHDLTGNRRFLIIPTLAFAYNHSVDMQQVYAQCKYLFDTGFYYKPTKKDTKLLNLANEQYVSYDWYGAMADQIRPGAEPITVTELLMELGIQRPTGRDTSIMGRRLKNNGFTKTRIRAEGRSQAFYYHIDRASIGHLVKGLPSV